MNDSAATPRLSGSRTKWIALGALAVAGAAFALLAAGGIGENLVYYWGPAELVSAGSKAYGATIRLGGQVARLVARAREQEGARAVSLRCLDFLDANDFWTAAGFRLIGAEPGEKGRLNVWGRVIRPEADGRDTEFAFHSRLHPCPRCGTPTTDTWTRGAVRRRLCAPCVAAGA